jgi:Ceramidase
MDWSRPVDLYCERTDPSFWAEPVNAISNVAFLIAAAAAYMEWRRAGGRDTPVLLLIVLTAVIGAGSFIFHTVATSGAVLFDTIPIAVFIYGYLFFAMRRYLDLSMPIALALLVAFIGLSYAESAIVPEGALNGSHAYLPAWAATMLIGVITIKRTAGLVLAAGVVLSVSLVFRSIDRSICTAFPLGTHFLWHILNGVVLYLLLRSALIDRVAAAKMA